MSHSGSTPAIDYIRKLYAAQDALLADIDAMLVRESMAINVGAEEGRLLQMLISLRGIKTVVEVGTLAGYSTIWMARALPEDGHIHTIDKDPKSLAMARDSFARCEVKNRITLVEGEARQALSMLTRHAPFDMIFIDADKISYPDYLDWAEKHVKKGGLVVADNTFLFGTVWQEKPPEGTAPATWNAMRRFNERLADKSRYDATMIPTEQGLSVAIKLF